MSALRKRHRGMVSAPSDRARSPYGCQDLGVQSLVSVTINKLTKAPFMCPCSLLHHTPIRPSSTPLVCLLMPRGLALANQLESDTTTLAIDLLHSYQDALPRVSHL